MDDSQTSATSDPSDTTPSSPPPAVETPRPSRAQSSRRSRRTLAIAISLGAVLLIAGVAYGSWTLWSWSENRAPERLVVVGESKLEDGTTVAGLVALIESQGGALQVEARDSGEEVAIPGTSYDRLRDALTMGGADEVVAVVTGEDQKRTAWVVLDEAAWARLIDQAGGVQVDIPEETTVFTGEQLYRFSKGTRKLSGAEAVALVMGADDLEASGAAARVRVAAGATVARALSENPETARAVLGGPGVELSADRGLIESFLSPQRSR